MVQFYIITGRKHASTKTPLSSIPISILPPAILHPSWNECWLREECCQCQGGNSRVRSRRCAKTDPVTWLSHCRSLDLKFLTCHMGLIPYLTELLSDFTDTNNKSARHIAGVLQLVAVQFFFSFFFFSATGKSYGREGRQ